MSQDYDKLSQMGEEQARKLGYYFAKQRVVLDRVFSGPGKRHAATMSIASQTAKDAGVEWPEPVTSTAFDEFDAFTVMKTVVPVMVERDETIRTLNEDFWANQHSPEAGRILQKLFEAVARRWCTGEFDTPNVESWAQFRARIAGAVDLLRGTATRSSHTVVFTSAGPIAATVAYALDLPHEKAIELVWLSRNCSFAQFLFSGDRFSLHAFNAIPHLDDLAMVTYR